MLFLDWLLGAGESVTLAVPPGDLECVFEHRASGSKERREVETAQGEELTVEFEPK